MRSYMAEAGHAPQAARDLWVRMGEASKGQSRPPEFLSTHPSDETRVCQIDGWLPEVQ
jgi:predicted Zn-dependent protease